MNSDMVKPEKFAHLHLVYHFTVPWNVGDLFTSMPNVMYTHLVISRSKHGMESKFVPGICTRAVMTIDDVVD